MPPSAPRTGTRARRVRATTVALGLALATVLGTTLATARAPRPANTIDTALLTRVVRSVRPAVPAPRAVLPARSAGPAVAPDFADAKRSWAPRPEPQLDQTVRFVLRPTPTPPPPRTPPPSPRPVVSATKAPGAQAQPPAPAREPTPAPVAAGGSSSVSGEASWYCQAGVSACHRDYPGGMYAAAGPALRVGDWRGRSVSVCGGGGGCVAVTLVDWCQCYGTRVIDLYSDAYRQLAPLNSGTMQVTVSW